MDQYLSTVIIALITGIFSLITLVIQKKQDKVINKIDEQTMFIEKEKGLKQKLTQKEKERESLIHEIMILILDTNLYILKNTPAGGDLIPTEEVMKTSQELKEKFNKVAEEIQEISKEYALILELANDLQKEVEKEKDK